MKTEHVRGKTTKILVMNPNSSQAMTDGMRTIIDSIDLPYSTEIHTYTAPSKAPASINNEEDIGQSLLAVLRDLRDSHPSAAAYDGVVVACYSVHPLVEVLQGSPEYARTTATGIFEASVLTALSLLGPRDAWGIVTTGKFWETHLASGVRAFLGGDAGAKFAGVESTGLNAGDFHRGVDPAVVRRKLSEATKRLLARKPGVKCVAMGCAGMAGLEEIIRSAACEEKGEKFAYGELHVIDGVRAGIMQVEQMIRHQRLLPGKKPS
ncbi:Asp/Glu/hydantoin racemase [Jackrogersella minutella]|nr:Asp/Glu/hydantoin racemase [Jackrogersella minutella]